MRADSARRIAFHAASISFSTQRASEQIVEPRTLSAIAAIAAASPGDAIATGFNDVHLERFQLLGDLDLFVQVHAAAGGLLAVTQGCIKNTNRSTHFLVLTFNGFGCTGTKKASSLNRTLRDEAKLRGTTLVAAYTAATSARIQQCAAPVTVGIRSSLLHFAFSGQLPGEFHRFLTLPCTRRQLSVDRRRGYFTRSSPFSIWFYIILPPHACQEFF